MTDPDRAMKGRMIARYGLVAVVVAATACGPETVGRQGGKAAGGQAEQTAGRLDGSKAEASVIMFIGTSLTAGLGVEPDQAYPALIQRKIDSAGLSYRVVNAGVSGETSAGALRRVDWLLKEPVSVVVLETGANDGLRGQEPGSIRQNIQTIIDRVHRDQPNARMVLVGMNAMPNLGRSYVGAFEDIYRDLARRNQVAYVPSLLQGVGGVDSLNQPDGIHPTPKGHAIMANTVWQTLRPLLVPSR
jgi:acyl-CoA thioesterase-1